jgi:hypothetical protein
VEKRLTRAKVRGDWGCVCGMWNRGHWLYYGRCKKEKAKCRVEEDWDDSLDHSLHGSYPARNAYCGKGERHPESTGGESSAAVGYRENAEYCGTKGMSQEKRNMYR